MPQIRLHIDPPQDGPTNMAVDACLLELAGGSSQGFLRFYRWRPATLSLGYFQCYQEYLDLCANSSLVRDLPGLAVVRRCTGGGAILHADELTYSLVLPAGHALATGSPQTLYTWMHARIAEAVAALGGRTDATGGSASSARGGPFLCYECLAQFDLLAGGEKLVGSAQRRARGAVLQHGSVVLQKVHPAQPGTSLREVLSRPVVFDELAEALAQSVGAAGLDLSPATPSSVEAQQLASQRTLYASEGWTRRR